MMKPVLSINILCSGRPETIKCIKALDSLRQAVDCELIITDTGCDDGLRSQLEEMADKVIDFEWCNDFSAARNAGLAKAAGDWFMYVDDDEIFDEDILNIIEFFVSDEYKSYDCASYFQRNFRDFEGNSFSDIAVLRLARISEDLKFKGMIHEYLTVDGGYHKLLSAHVKHFGYVSADAESVNRRMARNIPLLLKMMEEEPGNSRWPAHLAQELRAAGDLKALYDLCSLMLAKTKDSDDSNTVLARNTFYAGRSIGAAGVCQLPEKIALIEQALKDERINGVTRAFLLSYGCELYFKAGMSDKCLTAGREYMRLYEIYKADAERLADETVIFTDVTFDEAHLRYIKKYIM